MVQSQLDSSQWFPPAAVSAGRISPPCRRQVEFQNVVEGLLLLGVSWGVLLVDRPEFSLFHRVHVL